MLKEFRKATLFLLKEYRLCSSCDDIIKKEVILWKVVVVVHILKKKIKKMEK